MRRSIGIAIGSALLLLAILALWQLVSDQRLISPVFFPPPSRVAVALYNQAVSGSLWFPLLMTSLRMLSGWLLAVFIGLSLGALIGLSRQSSDYLEPSLEFLRTLPASAVLPIFIMLMGLTDLMVISVIAFGSLWPVLLGSLHGFRSTEPRLLEVSRTLELDKKAVLTKITLPHATPDILAVARISIGFALILAVVAEMLSSLPGLGNNVLLASRSFRSADLYAGIIVLGILGATSTGIINALERRLLRWRPQLT
jgi:sulfonate transport system permease protein